MLRSFLNLVQAPLGFDPAGVMTIKAPFSLRQYPKTEQRAALIRDMFNRVGELPGVESVSAASPLPLGSYQQTRRVGRPDRPDASAILATQQVAFPGYLSVVGTSLSDGRDFTDSDIAAQRDVTIINESLAERLWPEGAIGKVLSVHRTGWRQDLEVIGVTAAVRATRVRDESTPHFMIPYHIYPGEVSLVVKMRGMTKGLEPLLKSAVDAANGGRAAFDIRPMSSYVSESISDTRFILFVLAAFAGTAVLLAAVGLYATLSYLTARRTREFGIRLALGSSMKAIVAIVVRESVMLATAGSTLGLIGAITATGAVRELLYGVEPLDGITLLLVVILVAGVSLIAAGVPALRATRIDPQISLRSD